MYYLHWKQHPHFHLCTLNNLEKNLASQSISKSYSVSAATYLVYKKYYSSSVALLHFYSRFLSFYTRLKVNTYRELLDSIQYLLVLFYVFTTFGTNEYNLSSTTNTNTRYVMLPYLQKASFYSHCRRGSFGFYNLCTKKAARRLPSRPNTKTRGWGPHY